MVAIHTCEPLNLEKVGGGVLRDSLPTKKPGKKIIMKATAQQILENTKKMKLPKKQQIKKNTSEKQKQKKTVIQLTIFDWLAR